MNALILSAYVAVGTPEGQMLPDSDAIRYVGKAMYKQTGLDKRVKYIEKRHLPKSLKKYGGYAMLIVRISTEKRISYTWRF